MKKLQLIFFTILLAIGLTGCLTTEYKIYEIKINKDGSGTMTVTYANIFSQISEDDSAAEVISEDFSELLTKYVLSDEELLQDFENAEILDKKLYENKGQLWGDVVYKFDNTSEIGLFKYNENCPYMFKFTSDEEYLESNGSFEKGINMVVWNGNKKKLTLKTIISEPDSDDVSLLDMWKKLKE